MPSSYGTDAGITALEASYRRLAPLLNPARLSPRHKERLDNEAILHLKTMELWRRARVVLLCPSEQNGVDMVALAQEAFDASKRVGLCVRPTDTDDDGSGDAPIDFVEIVSADEVESQPARVPMVGAWHSEGDTTGFACGELMDSVCIVPGLVFDGEGHRIASDASAWDKFLAYYPGHKVALVHSLQVSSNPLPIRDGDIRVDYVVSNGSVWRCRPDSMR